MVATAAHRPRPSRPRRRIAAAAALAAVAGTLLAPGASARASACPHARTPVTQANHVAMQDAVVCLVNRERVAHHLPKLVRNAKLDRSAQGWTNRMVSGDGFSHGTAFMDRISAAGFDWSNVAENIATGYTIPTAVVRAWMRSPGHCANILNPIYREVGTGVADRMIHGASNIDGTWTQDFGRQMGQRSLSRDFGPAEACYRR